MVKLKGRKFFGLIPTFLEVTGENLVGRRGVLFVPRLSPPSILNKVKNSYNCFLEDSNVFLLALKYEDKIIGVNTKAISLLEDVAVPFLSAQ